MGTIVEGVDSVKVRSIIDRALAAVRRTAGTLRADQAGVAWRSLVNERRGPRCIDVNLAAAEHYMYARYLAGKTGDPFVRVSPAIYGLMKRVVFFVRLEKCIRTDPSFPALPPNKVVEDWGVKGADDGIRDYELDHPGAGRQYGAALRSLKSDMYRIYKL